MKQDQNDKIEKQECFDENDLCWLLEQSKETNNKSIAQYYYTRDFPYNFGFKSTNNSDITNEELIKLINEEI